MTQIAATVTQDLPRRSYGVAALAALALFALTYDLRVNVRGLDHGLTLALNAFGRHSHIIDHLMTWVSTLALFQSAPVVALAFAAFYLAQSNPVRVRLLACCVAASLGALASRGLQLFLPNLKRPFGDVSLPFQLPYNGTTDGMGDWSSFPSDHVTLLWGLAIAIFLANRRLGLIALTWVTLSQIARVYCGIHYPTDIVGGGLLGAAVVCAAMVLVDGWEDRLTAFGRARPALTATLAFMVAIQIATLFDDVRFLSAAVAHDAMMASAKFRL